MAAGRQNRDNARVIRRPFLVTLLGLLLLAAVVAACASGKSVLTITVSSVQGLPKTHAHPPAGPVGDTTDSTLTLSNGSVAQLGKAAFAKVGTMALEYTIRHECSGFNPGKCTATADFKTLSTLPGGTITADGKKISISKPTIVIPVTSGTGRFAGATGTVSISPAQKRQNVYRLTLP